MSNLTDFAKSELERAGLFNEDGPYGGLFGPAILKMIEAFADEGHSGNSARIAVSLFERLALFEPITALTGDDDEWMEIGDGYYQNRRCPHVFKENGAAYDSRGRVFRDPDGATYTNGACRVPVTFPYTPTTEIVDRRVVSPEPEEQEDERLRFETETRDLSDDSEALASAGFIEEA